jgi:hypothetical protein
MLRVTPLPDRDEAMSDDRIGPGEMFLDSLLNRPPRHVSPAAGKRAARVPRPTFSVTPSLEAWSAPAAGLRAWLFPPGSPQPLLGVRRFVHEPTCGHGGLADGPEKREVGERRQVVALEQESPSVCVVDRNRQRGGCQFPRDAADASLTVSVCRRAWSWSVQDQACNAIAHPVQQSQRTANA